MDEQITTGCKKVIKAPFRVGGAIGGIIAGTSIGLINAPSLSLRAAVMSAGANPPPNENKHITNLKALGLFTAGLPVIPIMSARDGCVEGWKKSNKLVDNI